MVSKLQKESGLSHFEMTRASRAVRDVTKQVNQMQVKTKFTCPICLSVMRKTTTVMACLHRFCENCINSWLRAGNKQCPSCREKIATHRSLREDREFDALVSAIFPDLDQIEKAEEERIAKLNRDVFRRNTHKKIVDDGLKRQQRKGKAWPKENDAADTQHVDMSSASTAPPSKSLSGKKRALPQEAPPPSRAAAAAAPQTPVTQRQSSTRQQQVTTRQSVQQQQQQGQEMQDADTDYYQLLMKQQGEQAQESTSSGKRRAAAAAATLAARRTYIHHPAGQKPKLTELLLRASVGTAKLATAFDFAGAGRYLSMSASMNVLDVRKLLATRCRVNLSRINIVLVPSMALEDRLLIGRVEEYWVERGPAVLEFTIAMDSGTGGAGASATTTKQNDGGAAGTKE